MRKLGSVAFLALLVSVAFVVPSGTVQAQPATSAVAQPEPLIESTPRRARPRIRVQPRYPYRNYHVLSPLPYDYEYPGPNARRDCVSRLVPESRPSGTVIVPRMRCWWVQG